MHILNFGKYFLCTFTNVCFFYINLRYEDRYFIHIEQFKQSIYP